MARPTNRRQTVCWILFFGYLVVLTYFILPVISRRGRHWYKTFLLSVLFSLGIETVQLIFKVGSFDVDDMFLNTIGGITGFIFVKLCTGIGRLWNG